MGKYLDGSGLTHLMGIIKGWAVPKTRTVNGHALSADVTVTASDIGVASGAEVNQNAFSNVKVGSTTIAADAKTDTLELVAGSNVTLTPDSTNDKVTIASTDTQYSDFAAATSNADGTHGLVPAPAAGTNTQDLVLSSGGGWKGVGDIITDQAAIGGSAEQGFVMVGAQLSGYPRPVGIVNIPVYGQKVFHAVCETAAGTADKVATLDDTNGYSLTAGVTVAVTFKYGNSADTPTLQVTHGSDAKKTIATPKDATNSVTSNGNKYNTWGAYETILFTYSGVHWISSGSGRELYQAYSLACSAAPKASPALTGTPTAPTAAAGTNTTQIATTAFVTRAVDTAASGALMYKGTVSAESTITDAAYKRGWYYVVATAGTYLGKVCEVGDMLIAKQDKTSTPANDWDAVQSNIEVLSNGEIDTLWAAA